MPANLVINAPFGRFTPESDWLTFDGITAFVSHTKHVTENRTRLVVLHGNRLACDVHIQSSLSSPGSRLHWLIQFRLDYTSAHLGRLLYHTLRQPRHHFSLNNPFTK